MHICTYMTTRVVMIRLSSSTLLRTTWDLCQLNDAFVDTYIHTYNTIHCISLIDWDDERLYSKSNREYVVLSKAINVAWEATEA
jgi:hypothetical protein